MTIRPTTRSTSTPRTNQSVDLLKMTRHRQPRLTRPPQNIKTLHHEMGRNADDGSVRLSELNGFQMFANMPYKNRLIFKVRKIMDPLVGTP